MTQKSTTDTSPVTVDKDGNVLHDPHQVFGEPSSRPTQIDERKVEEAKGRLEKVYGRELADLDTPHGQHISDIQTILAALEARERDAEYWKNCHTRLNDQYHLNVEELARELNEKDAALQAAQTRIGELEKLLEASQGGGNPYVSGKSLL